MIEKDLVRERVSLRELFERDGHLLKRAGAALVCRCPFHDESSASCHVHDEEGFFKCFGCDAKGDTFKYWMLTRGVPFADALADLAKIVGLADGAVSPASVRRTVAPEPEPVQPLTGEALDGWLATCQRLESDGAAQRRIAAWRGYSVETVAWAAKRGWMGLLPYLGVEREAFLVEMPGDDGPAPVGVHLRLGPATPGNDRDKASWRFGHAVGDYFEGRKGIPAFPFVIGSVGRAKVIFAVEGQWDALALVDVMGWSGEAGMPPGVAIVGMRGASSWKLFLDRYHWPDSACVFAIADADNAGKGWFAQGGFLERLRLRVRRLWGFWPAVAGCKDFNDLVKANAITAEDLTKLVHSRMGRAKAKERGTFLRWCKAQALTRNDEIGMAAWLVVRDRRRPRGRKPLRVWERHWNRTARPEHQAWLRAAFREWLGVEA